MVKGGEQVAVGDAVVVGGIHGVVVVVVRVWVWHVGSGSGC